MMDHGVVKCAARFTSQLICVESGPQVLTVLAVYLIQGWNKTVN